MELTLKIANSHGCYSSDSSGESSWRCRHKESSLKAHKDQLSGKKRCRRRHRHRHRRHISLVDSSSSFSDSHRFVLFAMVFVFLVDWLMLVYLSSVERRSLNMNQFCILPPSVVKLRFLEIDIFKPQFTTITRQEKEKWTCSTDTICRYRCSNWLNWTHMTGNDFCYNTVTWNIVGPWGWPVLCAFALGLKTWGSLVMFIDWISIFSEQIWFLMPVGFSERCFHYSSWIIKQTENVDIVTYFRLPAWFIA